MACIQSFPPKTAKELRKILKEVERENTVIALMLELMALTGLRYSDCSVLKFDDVMINGVVRDSVTIVQKKSYSKRLSCGVKEETARNASKVEVVLSGEQAEEVILDCLFIATKGEGLLFASSKCKGKPYTAQYTNRILKKVAKKMGLKYSLSTHSFRKSFAFMILNNGARINQIRDKLGHSSIAVTDHYLRTFMSDGDDFVKQIKF